MAVEEGIAAELLDSSAGIPAQALIARLSKRFHDDCRVVEADVSVGRIREGFWAILGRGR
jgi:hypothetical protein